MAHEQRFAISEAAADWYALTMPQCNIWSSNTGAKGLRNCQPHWTLTMN